MSRTVRPAPLRDAAALLLALLALGCRDRSARAAEPHSQDARPSGRWAHLEPQVERLKAEGGWTDRIEGPSTEFWPNGVRKSEGELKDGRRTGLWKFWYESGQLRWQGEYRDGKVDGNAIHWYENGQIHLSGEYHDDKQDGDFKAWHENGQLWWVGRYVNDRKEGAFRFWHEDGSVDEDRTGLYRDNERIGPLGP